MVKNKEMLNDKYGIPKTDENGHFYLIVWLFGDGYKESGKYDRLCFDDMKPPVNCIEKERVFSVSFSKNRGTMFTGNDSEYRLKTNGEILKIEGE